MAWEEMKVWFFVFLEIVMFSTVVMGVDSVVVSVVVVSVVVVSVGVVSVMAVSMVVSPMVSSHLPRGNTRGWWLELQHRFGKVLPHTAPQLDTPLGHKAPRSTVTSRSQPPAAPRAREDKTFRTIPQLGLVLGTRGTTEGLGGAAWVVGTGCVHSPADPPCS